MNKKSIIIIIIVALLVIGVFLTKTFQKKEENKTAEVQEEEINEDFKYKITEKIDWEKLKAYNLPIIIDFGADYCMPCRQMAPALKAVNKEMQGKAIVRYVDTVRYAEVAEDYKIELIPTQILVNKSGTPYMPENAEQKGIQFIENENGEIIYSIHIGALTKSQILEMLKEMEVN